MTKVTASERRESAQVMEELTRLDLLAAFSDAGVITPVSLNLAPIFKGRNLATAESFDTWAQLGVFFGRVHRSAKWWIGDWLNFGEGAFGERYAQAADSTGLTIAYLQNIAWVARNVLPSRRRDGVSFSSHAEVASLPPDSQTRWLDEAIKSDWSSRDLRRAIQASERPEPEHDGGGGDGDTPPEKRPLSAQRIYETATSCAAAARREGAVYIVPAEQFNQLLAAIGKGD